MDNFAVNALGILLGVAFLGVIVFLVVTFVVYVVCLTKWAVNEILELFDLI